MKKSVTIFICILSLIACQKQIGIVPEKISADILKTKGSDESKKTNIVKSESEGQNDDKISEIKTINIGTQKWMKENLNVPKYRNGDLIPKVTDPNVWVSLSSGAWCWYNNDSATYASTYGRLYNWYAVNDSRGLAPIGFHIASDDEWTTLITYLGGTTIAGGAMKETGFLHWQSPNTNATNSSGFTGLPGGYRSDLGNFSLLGYNGAWWSSSSTSENPGNAWFRDLGHNYTIAYRYPGPKVSGFTVRCMVD